MTTGRSREPLATTDEVAAYLKRSRRTLEDWRYRRIGPPFQRAGAKNVLYRWSDVDQWLESQTTSVGAA